MAQRLQKLEEEEFSEMTDEDENQNNLVSEGTTQPKEANATTGFSNYNDAITNTPQVMQTPTPTIDTKKVAKGEENGPITIIEQARAELGQMSQDKKVRLSTDSKPKMLKRMNSHQSSHSLSSPVNNRDKTNVVKHASQHNELSKEDSNRHTEDTKAMMIKRAQTVMKKFTESNEPVSNLGSKDGGVRRLRRKGTLNLEKDLKNTVSQIEEKISDVRRTLFKEVQRLEDLVDKHDQFFGTRTDELSNNVNYQIDRLKEEQNNFRDNMMDFNKILKGLSDGYQRCHTQIQEIKEFNPEQQLQKL